MKTTGLAVAAIGIASLLAAGIVAADTETIRALAHITMNINHYPSNEDKETLEAIIASDDTLEEEAALAMALANMEHNITAADAERLAEIVDDEFYGDSVRKLAVILLSINHSPSDDDKAALAAMLD